MQDYFAHKRDNGVLQTVREHLEGTAEFALAFGEGIGMPEEAKYAALLHDIGKYTQGFQRRLLENGPKVDHATAGMLEAVNAKHPQAAFAIAGHHTGLPDLGAAGDTPDSATLRGKMRRKPGLDIMDYSAFRSYVEAAPPAPPLSRDPLDFFLRTKMLYSCLVDADWLDTERFVHSGRVERGAGEPMERLSARLDAWVAERGWRRPGTRETMTLNEMRSDVFFTCMDRASLPPGLFTLTVPTGGGKTTASLAFAIRHALRLKYERILYVIPYTSIIDQTARKFREILGAENVLEHHFQVKADQTDDSPLSPEARRLALATENWDAPLIVTTSVQFFESLFTNQKSPSRKIHNIAKSVILFDEAQMLPLPLLKPCVAAIARLSKDFGVSAVLCTATQPALKGLIAQYSDGMPICELAPDPAKLNACFRRTTFNMAGPMEDGALASELNRQKQALCIVNSKRHAQALFEKLEPPGAYQLTTLLYPAHRKRKLEEICSRLREGLPCRVISTSLIEVGVDVDFPAVYRAVSGLDSILQAAGRCNREGRYAREESIVTVFEPEQPSPRMFKPNIEAALGAMQAFDDPASLEAIQEYFAILYGNKGDRLDDKGIMRDIGNFAFATVGEKFKLIEGKTRRVCVLFREGKAQALERRLRAGERSRALLRELGRYSVNVYDDHFRALVGAGAIERIDEDITFMISPSAYDDDIGLTLAPEGGDCGFL